MAELLGCSPHPSIATYMRDGRIIGLCWQRYEKTMDEPVKHPFEKKTRGEWLEDFEGNIAHIHSLGLC